MKKTNSRNIYLVLLLTGFISTVSVVFENNYSVSELAWFFWAANLVSAPVILFFTQVERILRAEEGSTLSRWLKSLLTLGSGLGALYMFQGVTGAFLSVFAEISPEYYFGKNGFFNHIEPEAILLLFQKYFLLFPGYLMGKSYLMMDSSLTRTQIPGVARDAVLSVILCMIAKLVFKENAQAGILIFCGIFFFPWKLIITKDIGGKRVAKEADLDPEIKIPADFIDKGPGFWGMAVVLFGMVFTIVGFTAPIFMIGKNGFVISNILMSGIFIVAFAGFGILAIVIGLNMSLGYRKIKIEAGTVKCEKRLYAPFSKMERWEIPLSDFRLDSRIIPWDSDGIRHDQYVVELIHPSDRKKNVTLYRAYHSDDLQSKKEKWKLALGLN